ncbi:MAG TPA: oligoendopeptidase F [Anaerolineales bacterium]|nr:oligoendopeptidase F [Anaerolineales bacterium]
MPLYPPRDKVDRQNTWNSESVFVNEAAWEAELRSVLAGIADVQRFQGRLGESAAVLLQALTARDQLWVRAQRVYMYAGFAQAVDTTNQQSAGMHSQAGSMFGQVAAALAFFAPELIDVGHDKLRQWMQQDVRLAVYAHSLDDLFRRRAHVRSAEVEELLGMLADPFDGPAGTASMLTNADLRFAPATTSSAKKLEVTQSSLPRLLHLPDRAARQSAWNNYMDRHLEFKNTLASNLVTSIKASVVRSRARRHESSLAASLFDSNIPVEVFHSLLDTFQRHLPIWHRYFELRRKALRLRSLAYYDLWAPLAPRKVKITFEQAVELIAEGLAPLGLDYTAALRRGCLEQRWIDWIPNKGKASGAFSYGAPGTHPFILMSFSHDVSSLSTLAHELGHSMHSYLTWKHQPLVYTDYSLFVAEVASNFHQAMVRAHLLKTSTDRSLLIAVIEEAMDNFLRYFLQMPLLARFELEAHRRVEAAGSLTADDMSNLLADLFAEGLGPAAKIDRPRVGMVWSTFGHLFADYYVYQYATGISGAHALADRILKGDKGAADDYLGFLRAGASAYPLEVLRQAGVDLASPQPVEQTFAIMEEYIHRLEKLLA